MKILCKRCYVIPVLITITFLFYVCSDIAKITDPIANNPPAVAFETVSSSMQKLPYSNNTDRLRRLVAAENSFALALYKDLNPIDGNFFFSPHSIVSALGMALAGAKGETAEQMRKVLYLEGIADLEGAGFHTALNDMNLGLGTHADSTNGIDLNIVNDAWGQMDWKFQNVFLDNLAQYYGAGMKLLNFKAEPDKARDDINTYISDITNSKIKNLLPQGSVSNDTRLVLTNAVYFLANWLYTFDKSATKNDNFFLLDGSTVSVPLMQLGETGKKLENLKYAWHENYKTRALQFPYLGEQLAMVVFLPDSGQFEDFEKALTPDLLNEIINKMAETSLPPVRFPKFTFESPSLYLVDTLKKMGMQDAFDSAKADFSLIDGTRDLHIANILHKSFISVNEEGTEAAAATAIVMDTTSIQPHTPEFIANRPFIYIIRDIKTDLIIFMGKVINPGS